MGSRFALLAFRLALLVAIGVSAALLIDYFRPMPAFCDVGSGCYKVRASGFGSVLRVPVPLIGLVGFTFLMATSLVESPLARRITGALALASGATGLVLLAVQAFVLKVFCKLCVAVDLSAIVAAFCALALPKAGGELRRDAPKWLWPAAAAMSMLAPGLWSVVQPSPPIPAEILELWVPGKINVVEYVDFECPFCRDNHPRLREVAGEYAGRLHVVRLNVPLASHPEARFAARAYCCAEDQGKAEEMADALFQSTDLSPGACERLAASLGLSLPAYRSCVTGGEVDARINAQYKTAVAAGLVGLPTVWVGEEVLVGSTSVEKIRSAFASAAQGRSRWPTALLWAGFALALTVVGLIGGLRGRRSPAAR